MSIKTKMSGRTIGPLAIVSSFFFLGALIALHFALRYWIDAPLLIVWMPVFPTY